MKPYPGFAEYSELIIRSAPAYAVMGAFFLMEAVSLNISTIFLIKIPFLLIGIFFWAIHRPMLLPLWLIFISGLVIDMLSGFLLGLHTILYIALFIGTLSQRRYFLSQPFPIIWIGFGIILFAANLYIYTIMCLAKWTLFPVIGIIQDTIWGFAIFPFLAIILHGTNKILLPLDNA